MRADCLTLVVTEAALDGLCWWVPPVSDASDAVDLLRRVCAEKGPFDGVMGFSQGAALAATLCAMQHVDAASVPWRFRFCVLIGGFVPTISAPAAAVDALKAVEAAPCTVPSLHIFGEADEIVVPERARALVARFADPIVAPHSGGHYIPSKRDVRDVLSGFMKQQATPSSTA